MQDLVDTITKQRKAHFDTIENLTIRDIKEMVKTHI